MAEEITLNAYIERIENMIRQGRMDEAIAHAAHVLQFYPKNAAVYRNMGRALMRQQRYDEAGEIFRRLLAAIPDDFSSHYQLSIIYESDNQADAALWHIERAFDSQPGNSQVNERLRDLYKKFRDMDVDKIQLTAGAVANQYVKAGMYDEAIEILERTLKKVPDRADLLLIKARAFWNRGDHIEAAEVALDIIKTYPFALEANRLLTELWLEAERPSDAQRYLSRVEAIDPFLAYELATDEVVDHKRFKVEELDFARYAASLASQEDAPAWLENIEELVEAEESAVEADVSLDDFDLDDDSVAEAASDDWLNELEDEATAPIVAKKVTDDLSDLLPDDFSFPDSAGIDDTVDEDDLADFSLFDADDDDIFDDLATESTGLTDLLGDLEDDAETDSIMDDGSTGLTGLLGEDDYGSPASETENLTGLLGKLSGKQGEKSQTDDLSWLDEVAGGEYDASHDDEVSVANKPDTDPLAWLNDDAILDSDDSDAVDDFSTDNLLEKMDTDPMAWLSGDNLLDEDISDSDDPMSTDDLNAPAPATRNRDDSTAWMQDSGIDFDADADVISPLFVEDNDPVSLASSDVDPMAWLGGDENFEDEDLFGTDALEDPVSDSEEDPMAWLEEEGVDFERTGEFEGLNTDDLKDADDDVMAWLDDSQVEITEDDDFVATQTDDLLTDQLLNLEDAEDTGQIENDPIAWLEEDGVEFLAEGEIIEDDDWLSDDSALDDLLNIADLTNTTGEEPLDDLFIDTEMQDTMTDQPDDSMDWLNADDSDDEVGDPAPQEDSMAWLTEAGINLDDDDVAEDETFEPVVEEDPMAWLMENDEPEEELNPDDYPTNDLGVDEEVHDWLEVEEAEAALEEDVAQPSSMLSFLNDDNDGFDLPDIESSGETDPFEEESDWLRALDGEEPLVQAQPEETFAGDFDDFGESDMDQLDWGDSDDSDTDDFDWDFGEAEDEESLDWMSEVESDVEPVAEDSGFDDFGIEDAEPVEADWLADLDSPEPVAEETGFDDFDDFDSDDSLEPAEADWLADLDSPEPVAEETGFDDFDDLDSDDSLEPAEADWLADLDSPEPVAEETGFEDFDDFDSDDSLEPAEADWLADLDSPEPVAEETGFDDFDDLDSDDSLEPAEADWLADLDSPEPVAEETGFDDFDDLDSDDSLEPAEADWLADLDSPEPVAEETGFEDFADLDSDDSLEPAEADWLADLDIPDAVAEATDFEDFADLDSDDSLEPAEADWLADLDSPEPVAEETGFDDFADFDSDDSLEPAEADWLADLDSPEPVAEETGDWGDIGSSFTDELDDEAVAEQEGDWADLGPGFTDELDDQESDWLASATEDAPPIDDFDLNEITTDDLAEPEGADWLNELDDKDITVEESGEWGVIGSSFTDELDDQAEAESSDWGEVGKAFTDELDDEESHTEPDPVAETDDDWLNDVAVQEEDNWTGEEEEAMDDYQAEEDYDLNISSTTGMTGMLQSIRVNRDDDGESAEESLPPWLADEDDSLPVFIPESELEDETGWEEEGSDYQEVVYEESDDDYFEEDSPAEEEALPLAEVDTRDEAEAVFVASGVDEADYEEETDAADADNAPDWLNAMVPGLDLDFEAEDEGYLDEGFDERDNTLRERNINESVTINSDFEWLQDIVEEESGMMTVIEDDYASSSPPPLTMPQRRRFDFSALPVWARGDAIENIVRNDDVADAVPDYLSGFEEDFESAQDYDGQFDDNFEFETDEVITQDDEFNIEDETATTVNESLNIDSDFDDEFAGDFDDFDDAFDDEFDDFTFDDEFDD